MIRSMTGFGRAEVTTERRKITVEMKAVNNRYLDLNIRLPRKFNFLEAKIRGILKEEIARGKVDVFISTEEYGDEAGALTYNETLAGEYIGYMRQMAAKFGLNADISVADVARAPEVFSLGSADTDDDELWAMLEPVVKGAVQNFNDARAGEGERLKTDLLEKLNGLAAITDEVITHEPEIMDAYRRRLTETLNTMLEEKDLDESRVAAECVIYADKICTDEETVRLKSHIEQMKKELGKSGSIGRKLDFIAQEMNREANTTLSKAGDLITADLGIALKTEIEKIREQIQNIE